MSELWGENGQCSRHEGRAPLQNGVAWNGGIEHCCDCNATYGVISTTMSGSFQSTAQPELSKDSTTFTTLHESPRCRFCNHYAEIHRARGECHATVYDWGQGDDKRNGFQPDASFPCPCQRFIEQGSEVAR